MSFARQGCQNHRRTRRTVLKGESHLSEEVLDHLGDKMLVADGDPALSPRSTDFFKERRDSIFHCAYRAERAELAEEESFEFYPAAILYQFHGFGYEGCDFGGAIRWFAKKFE